jgi:myo-inositol 2-dehydrogenase / D-chiro-inositol 1-dehydrogenase
MEIVGSRDSIAIGLDQRTPLRSVEVSGPNLAGPAWATFLTRFESAYRAELLAFLSVARGERQSPCTARDALEAMRVAIAATTSRLEHRPVQMAEIATA